MLRMIILCCTCLLLIFFTFIAISGATPIDLVESTIEKSKEEKVFPNGTVMGKYTYVNGDGSPVHVRYFADNAGYGVELKSVKFKVQNFTQPNQKNVKLPPEENKAKIEDLLREMMKSMELGRDGVVEHFPSLLKHKDYDTVDDGSQGTCSSNQELEPIDEIKYIT